MRIRQAILAQFQINLTDYPLDPIQRFDLAGFLARNQQSHYEACAATGVQGYDLSGANLDDPAALTAWVLIHARAHRDLEERLGIGS